MNEAVRTGTPAASSRTTGSHEAPSSLRSSTASGGGAAPKPLGPGSATVTAATVLGSAKRYSIQASEDASTARGSDTVALNAPSPSRSTDSIGEEPTISSGTSGSRRGSSRTAIASQSTTEPGAPSCPHRPRS